MTKLWKSLGFIVYASFLTTAYAADVTIPIYLTTKNGTGKEIGNVVAHDTRYGLLLTPFLSGLTPGIHGFHIHENPNCSDGGMAAGGHLDPNNSGKHLGPYNNNGHLGDLAVLIVDKEGNATLPVLAPRLKVADIRNHSLMIHAGGDNYSDNPMMGGGGTRFACGVIP